MSRFTYWATKPEVMAIAAGIIAVGDGLAGAPTYAAFYGIGFVALIVCALHTSHRPDDGWVGIPSAEIRRRQYFRARHDEMVATGDEFELGVAKHYAYLTWFPSIKEGIDHGWS